MKAVFLYAGQGSQRVGMGKDFYEACPEYRDLLDSLDLGFDIKSLMHEGPLEQLSMTEYTQACMAAYAAGVTELLKTHGIEAEAAGGLSLGEYGALYCAGVFDAQDYIKLVTFRGQQMKRAAEGITCSMSAILGLDSQVIDQACKDYDGPGYITAVNFNCPGQTVICGDKEAVSNIEGSLKEKGAKRCMPLNVSGPFHTKYMKAAGDALELYFDNMNFKSAEIPVTSNATGDFYQAEDDIKALLVKQVQSSVYLEENLKKLIEAGYSNYIEIGPGKTLSGFLKKTAKAMGAKVEVCSIDSLADYHKLVESL